MLGEGEPLPHLFVTEALAEAAENLDAGTSRRAAEHLVHVLRNPKVGTTIAGSLKSALVSACRRLDAAGTAHVSDAILAALQDPQTTALVHTCFADVFVVLCGQLDAARAASLEDALVAALVADLADPKSAVFTRIVAPALVSVSRRPGARSASRVAEALGVALRDPKTSLVFLQPLAEALAAVCGQLLPPESALHSTRALAVLGSLWAARKSPGERSAIAGAMAAVWTLLVPGEAVAHARRNADELENAFRAADGAMMTQTNLANALAAVYRHLGQSERVRRTNAVADALIAALRRPATDVGALELSSERVLALCLNLDRPGAVRTADALLTVWGEPHVRRQQLEFFGATFKDVAVRLKEPDLQRLLDHPLAGDRAQRVILDVLGDAKRRRFRNTWDYLDWIESQGSAFGKNEAQR